MDYAYAKISSLIPLNAKKTEQLQEEDISYLDQYIFRFSKLQDAMGKKLFNAVLTVLGEEMQDRPFIDIFNRLEQLSIVENYSLWQELRTIRNEVAHEYGDDKEELAEKLNAILNSKEALENYLQSILEYLKNSKFLS